MLKRYNKIAGLIKHLMLEFNNTFTRADLISVFAKAHHEVAAYFSALPSDSFLKSPSNKWSPAENLLHLIKSVKPVTVAMKKPRWLLRLLFGKPQAASRRFEQIKETYQRALANGGKAPGRFIPVIRSAAIAATKTAPQRAQRTQRFFFVRFVAFVVKKTSRS